MVVSINIFKVIYFIKSTIFELLSKVLISLNVNVELGENSEELNLSPKSASFSMYSFCGQSSISVYPLKIFGTYSSLLLVIGLPSGLKNGLSSKE